MLAPLFAALAVGLLSPFLAATAHGVSIALFPGPKLVRRAAGGFVSTAVLGYALAMVLGATGIHAHHAFPLATTTASILVVGLSLLGTARRREARALSILLPAIEHDETRERAREELLALLDRARPGSDGDASHHATLVLRSTPALVAAGLSSDARARLEALDPSRLDRHLVPARAQALASIRATDGDFEGAEALLAELDPATVDLGWWRATKALLHAVQGGVEQALELVGDEDAEGVPPALRLRHVVVRAHVEACRGHTDAALAQLALLVALAGRPALEWAMRPVGPATDLARAVYLRDAIRLPGDVEDAP